LVSANVGIFAAAVISVNVAVFADVCKYADVGNYEEVAARCSRGSFLIPII